MKKGSSEGLRTVRQDAFRKILIVGIGNEYRGDDGVGLQIASQIRAKHLDHVTVLETSGEGTALMDAWEGYECVILVDAISQEAAAGTRVKIDAGKKIVPAKYFRFSTHAFGVAEAIALARTLHSLPPRLLLYGIVGASFSTGSALSRAVQESARDTVETLVTDIKAERR